MKTQISFTKTNDFGKEVFHNGTSFATILTYGIKEGVEKMEQVIKATYIKKDADYIISLVNSLK